jgi:hypothetical protein
MIVMSIHMCVHHKINFFLNIGAKLRMEHFKSFFGTKYNNEQQQQQQMEEKFSMQQKVRKTQYHMKLHHYLTTVYYS